MPESHRKCGGRRGRWQGVLLATACGAVLLPQAEGDGGDGRAGDGRGEDGTADRFPGGDQDRKDWKSKEGERKIWVFWGVGTERKTNHVRGEEGALDLWDRQWRRTDRTKRGHGGCEMGRLMGWQEREKEGGHNRLSSSYRVSAGPTALEAVGQRGCDGPKSGFHSRAWFCSSTWSILK